MKSHEEQPQRVVKRAPATVQELQQTRLLSVACVNGNDRGPCRSAGDVITKDDVFDVMEEDVAIADMVLWVGISFEQSASTSYFRRVRPRRSNGSHRRRMRPLRVTPHTQRPLHFAACRAGELFPQHVQKCL